MINSLAPTLIENILAIAKRDPQRVFVKLLFPGKEDVIVRYGELIEKSQRFRTYYENNGVTAQSTVILILKHGPELVYAFVGALLMRAVPSIFAHPSSKISKESYRETLSMMLGVCESRFLVTYPELATEIASLPQLPENLKILAQNGYVSCAPNSTAVMYAEDDLALLQHSSGTTGLKKGVALSNRSVVNQLRNYAPAIALSEKDCIVSWLPLYHDMGLIACFVLPLAYGIGLTLLSPFDWVASPARLFQAIREDKATLCWLPNFAYNFMAANIPEDQLESVDLSSVRCFINCSEPVSAESHDIFLKKFSARGLRPSALGTCYAMAETTFAVSQGGVHEPVRVETKDRHRWVSSGKIVANTQVRILDKDGREAPTGDVGEIAVRCDSMLSEYYHRPDLTAAALRDGWYLTGDLGYLSEGHLFVTGRKKDMIIVAGKNIYPHDIEEIVSAVTGVKAGRVVAFGVYREDQGTEEVVVLAETELVDAAALSALKLAIAKTVRERSECVVNVVGLKPLMWLVKSSSGKISRSANKQKFLTEEGR